ncbi:MAG: chemotaxis protein CheW [Candidatus Calescibacterium sp.]|nr:chemotaxis protein CheW [Candidatus Calescibacterium sp.]MCX7733705.1 chemotaxis protein CheW [bacterium]MDW8087511.1 chemotaxis protein CheW [Candidatus Calescibacterium sp.]
MGIFGKNPLEEISENVFSESIWKLPENEPVEPQQPQQIPQQQVPVITPQVVQQYPYPPVFYPYQAPPPVVPPESKKQERQETPKREEETKKTSKKGETKKASYLLNFTLGNEFYGVDVENIREVVRSGKITPVPNAHYNVLGIMNLRGRIIPVLSLRRFFNMEDIGINRKSKILVIESEGGNQIGVLVDDVNEVFTYYVDELEPITSVKFSGTRYARGIFRKDEIPIVVIDIKEILSEIFL